jgi:hypothetical protein
MWQTTWRQTENTVNTADTVTDREYRRHSQCGDTENTVNTKNKREKKRHKDKEINTVRRKRQHTVPNITVSQSAHCTDVCQ